MDLSSRQSQKNTLNGLVHSVETKKRETDPLNSRWWMKKKNLKSIYHSLDVVYVGISLGFGTELLSQHPTETYFFLKDSERSPLY